jgi:hypothetical protein
MIPYQEWYGVERDSTISSPTWTRIGGNMSLHKTLPVHNLLKACLISSGNTINYYLNPTDWSKKLDNSASNLTGADGNVMIRKTASSYWKFETVGNIQRVKCSLFPLPGFYEIKSWNYGAYEGIVTGSTLKSISGVLPTTSISLTNFRTYARNNGSGYNQQLLEPYSEIIWLAVIEFATFNMQLAVNNNLTVDGYRQGGMGNGVTTAIDAEWLAYNNRNPFIICGSSNSLASGSGEVSVNIINFSGTTTRTFTVPRYRGIENFFGHIWKWTDGVYFNSTGGTQSAYVFDNPANIVDNTSVGARYIGDTSVVNGYITKLIFDNKGSILPLTNVGGNSGTYICDYFYTPTINTGWYALLCGGTAADGGGAGPFFANTSSRSTRTGTSIGARLTTN